MARRQHRERILLLWNLVGQDEYQVLADRGPAPLWWAPGRTADEVGTVQDEIDAIAAALRTSGFRVRVVNVADDLEVLLDAVRSFRPHAIFNMVEFFNDDAAQEGCIAGLYDLLGVPYTGAGPLALLTCQRKFRTKVLLESQGVPTPAYFRVTELPLPREIRIPFPLIVKPAREDASGGIHADAVVHDRAALEDRVRRVLEDHQQPALVERYVDGREIHVAILGNSPPEVLPLLELEFADDDAVADGPRILTYEAKWDPLSPEFYALDTAVPARVSARIGKRVRAAALAAYATCGCRDYARVDLRLDASGAPFVLEVNPNPDLAEGVGFMLCAEKSGRTFAQTIRELTELALARGPKRARRASRARSPRRSRSVA